MVRELPNKTWMLILEEELHPPRREEGPTLRFLSETLTLTLSLFSNYNNCSASLLQDSSLMCWSEESSFYLQGRNFEKWRTSPDPPRGGSRLLLVCYGGLKVVGENRAGTAWTGPKPLDQVKTSAENRKKGGSGANRQQTANWLQPANRGAPRVRADRVPTRAPARGGRRPTVARHVARPVGSSALAQTPLGGASASGGLPRGAAWFPPRGWRTAAPGWRHTDVTIGHYFLHSISFAPELQSRQMICPFGSSQRARHNGAVYPCIWDCMWSWYILYHNCSYLPATKYTTKLVEFIRSEPYSYVAYFYGVTFMWSWQSKIGT
jgi:hypothetical protein